MNWIQALLLEGLSTHQTPSLIAFTAPGLLVISDLLIAIAGYIITGVLIYAANRRQDRSTWDLFWLGAASLGAISTLYLLDALSLRGAGGNLSNIVEGAALLTALGTAIALIFRLPALIKVSDPEVTAQERALTTPGAATIGKTTAIAEPLDQPLEEQVLTCNQALEKAHSNKTVLLQKEQNIRQELEVALNNLQDTAERLNIALSAAQLGSWEWNLATQHFDWSPKAKTILGFDPASIDLSYNDWVDRVYPEDLPKVEAAIARAREQREIFVAEYRIQHPQAGMRWVLSQGRYVFALSGEPRRMIGVIQDTTQAKQASLALKSSEAKFRAVFEQAAVGFTRLSRAGHWLQVNKTFCELLGYTADELVGKHFQELTDPADQHQDEHFYQQLMQGEVESCRFEKRYLHRDGTPIWVMVTVSTERDEDGNILSLIAVVEDIRQLKQTRSELEKRAGELEQVNSLLAITNAMLEKRNAELDQFAYVASHDLKAPLRAIANLSEWIEEDLTGQLPEENQHQLALLRNRVHRMEALINGLLEYSRVGRRDRQIEAVDVRSMLEETIDSISPPPEFTISLPNEMPTITTNRTALNQVFSNLISNAIKHHDRDEGLIQITAEDQGNIIEFAVADDGPGIAPEYHNKVFTIFQTLKSRDELESTGIGLSLVKKLVESEGGTIRLESALGEGATFRFSWPK